jgi:hypothetical protein
MGFVLWYSAGCFDNRCIIFSALYQIDGWHLEFEIFGREEKGALDTPVVRA